MHDGGGEKVSMGTPERAMSQVARVNLKLLWRLQGVGDAREIELLTKKVAGNEWNSPRERLCGWQMAKP
jgi:hypothetical protein